MKLLSGLTVPLSGLTAPSCPQSEITRELIATSRELCEATLRLREETARLVAAARTSRSGRFTMKSWDVNEHRLEGRSAVRGGTQE
jgi:hypothetical protein